MGKEFTVGTSFNVSPTDYIYKMSKSSTVVQNPINTQKVNVDLTQAGTQKTEAQDSTKTYTVKQGDSIWGILAKSGINPSEEQIEAFKKANNLKGNVIHAGDVVKTKESTQKKVTTETAEYIVKKDDTILTILQKRTGKRPTMGEVNDFATLNNIKDIDKIYPGQKLKFSSAKTDKTVEETKTAEPAKVVEKVIKPTNTSKPIHHKVDTNKVEQAPAQAPAKKITPKQKEGPNNIFFRKDSYIPPYTPEKSVATTATKNSNNLNPTTKTVHGADVVLDAGHGGSDSGAVGKIGDQTYKESEINKKITDKTKEILEQKYGLSVELTDSSSHLKGRREFRDKENPYAFVSIHNNSIDTTPVANKNIKGIEVIYHNTDDAKKFANIMTDNLKEKFNDHSQGYVRSPIDETKAVNRKENPTDEASVPSLIVETGYMSNKSDLNEFATPEGIDKRAEAIAKGISDFINSKKAVELEASKPVDDSQ